MAPDTEPVIKKRSCSLFFDFTRPLGGRAVFKSFRLSFLSLPSVLVLSRPAAVLVLVLVIEPDPARRSCGPVPRVDGDDWLFLSFVSTPSDYEHRFAEHEHGKRERTTAEQHTRNCTTSKAGGEGSQ